MICAIDVQYKDDTATAAAVVFEAWDSADTLVESILSADRIQDYEPGEFYRRELPCIQPLIETLHATNPLEVVIVDGYVDLGEKPGLGRHLFDALGGAIPIIGVAKSSFRDARPVEVIRGEGSRPLFITATHDAARAADDVARMHGPYRIPTLLKRVDQLARGDVSPRD